MDERSRRSVRETYETIGPHFSKTREYAWPEVADFLETQTDVETGLDVGCGNGRHAGLLADHAERVLALDASRSLLAVARDRVGPTADLLLGDAARLPLRDESVDLAVYVATLHHLPTAEARAASLDELARVLSTGSRALVSVWSTAHDRFEASPGAVTGFDTTVDWTLPGGETVARFYHIYAPEEFRRELDESALRTVGFEISSGNCYAVVAPEGKRP